MKWFWLSFADDEGFRGGCYVDIDEMFPMDKVTSPRAPNPKDQDFLHAVHFSHILKINPGGEVRGGPVGETPAEHLQHRLLSKEDLRMNGGFASSKTGKEIT